VGKPQRMTYTHNPHRSCSLNHCKTRHNVLWKSQEQAVENVFSILECFSPWVYCSAPTCLQAGIPNNVAEAFRAVLMLHEEKKDHCLCSRTLTHCPAFVITSESQLTTSYPALDRILLFASFRQLVRSSHNQVTGLEERKEFCIPFFE